MSKYDIQLTDHQLKKFFKICIKILCIFAGFDEDLYFISSSKNGIEVGLIILNKDEVFSDTNKKGSFISCSVLLIQMQEKFRDKAPRGITKTGYNEVKN